MNQPKVSVIVPVYNVEEYLPKCLDSLVSQSLQDIEILVINDGSPDNSQAIIDDYAKRYPALIRPFIKENGGLSDARNFGIQKAKGDYLAFVDSDDYVDLDFLEQMVGKAETTQSDIVCCPITYVYKASVTKTFYDEENFGSDVKTKPRLLYEANSFAWNKLYRRDFWMQNKFEFANQWFEDSQLIYNVLLSANKVSCVNIPFYYYLKVREESITNSVDPRVFDIFNSVESIVSFYKSKGVFEDINEQVEYICVRHLMVRVKALHQGKDKKMALEYMKRMWAFLETTFPNWKQCEFVYPAEDARLRTKVGKKVLRTHFLMRFYLCGPRWMFRLQLKAYRFVMRALRYKMPWARKKLQEKEKEEKRYYIQQNGLSILSEVQGILRDMGIVSFADFGTCLGLVREGRLLAHDLDMDMGAIADKEQQLRIRVELERRGYKLWRQYIHDDFVLEESYHYKQVKVDINYYEMTSEYARTWLFYRKPGLRYKDNTRHIVEMTYSPIGGIKTINVQGVDIAIPQNPELLLEEKYGANWRVPDKGWIYWESPAARKLDEIGYYITYKYKETIAVLQDEEKDS